MSNPEPKSPLTIIAIFAGIIEASALASLPFLDESSQSIYTWFLVGFPPFLTLLFFLTLNFNTKSLYGPDDQSTESTTAETSSPAAALSGLDNSLGRSPSLALPFPQTNDQATVVISGKGSQILLEVIARHAVESTSTGSLLLHNLDTGVRISIVSDRPSPDTRPCTEEQKKPRH